MITAMPPTPWACSSTSLGADVQVVSDGQSQELFAMQLVSYLSSFRSTKRRHKVELPVAFVFTKTDLCEEPIQDAAAFARANAPGLWRLCEARLERFQFFASSVAGSVAELVDGDGQASLVPLRVEPRGIIEPFSWLLTQYR